MGADKPAGRDSSVQFSARLSDAQDGRTLSEAVRAMLPEGTSWNQAREVCKRGKVRRNGQLARDAAERVAAGDRIEIDLHAARQRDHVLDERALVYADRELAIVNKPAGLLSVPFDERDKNTLVDRLRFLLQRRDGRKIELGAVHRLDKDTTGLIMFTRTLAAKRAMQEQFRVHALDRRYLAIAHGEVAAQRIETQLVADRGDGLRGSYGVFRRARGPAPRDAQRAVTEVRPLERLQGATLVECRLETGRTHQIRIHLSEQGHPLLGEPVYIRDYRARLMAAPRPMLHATSLGFTHPRTKEPLHFSEPPPQDFSDLLMQLRT